MRTTAGNGPAPSGTVSVPDAIHLATALAWREARNEALVLAIHAKVLGTAAQAMGLQVVGV